MLLINFPDVISDLSGCDNKYNDGELVVWLRFQLVLFDLRSLIFLRMSHTTKNFRELE